MPQVLLINPKITSARSARFPLSLLALAGALQGKYNCRIVDGNMDRDYLDAIRRTVRERHIEAAGITVMGGPQVQSAIQVSAAIREASPATRIIWGGYFPTLYRSAAINAPYVDYLVRGQGEKPFSALLDALLSGKSDNLDSIAGITWKRDGTAVHNADGAFVDHRSPTMLPYELLGNSRRYLASTFLGQRTAAYQVALGCRFRCTFCG